MDFEKQLATTVERLKGASEDRQVIRIYTHVDADGLTAGAILAKALLRARIPFQVRTLRQLEPKFLEQIAHNYRESPFLAVFTDFGSGQLPVIAGILPKTDVIICDHHELPPNIDHDFPFHLNPALFGHDGAKEVSAAGMSYFLARTLGSNNKDLAEIAIVGAIGDRQDGGEGHSVIGLNQEIVKDGVEIGVIEVIQGIRLFGRETRPIAAALSMSTEPYLRGLTGNQGACESLLRSIGIPTIDTHTNRPRTLNDLSQDETQTLMTSLVNFSVMNLNLDPRIVLDLIGTIYRFPHEPAGKPLRDAQEYATLLNSCGRTGRSDLGIAICLGDRQDALQEAEMVLSEYRKKMRDVLDSLEQGGKIRPLNNIYIFDAGDAIDEKMIGGICSVALVTLPAEVPKPLIGVVNSDDDSVKISGRAPAQMVSLGIDLGVAMRATATELGVEYPAGGHPAAAGAKVPTRMKEQFLELLDKKVGEMIGSR